MQRRDMLLGLGALAAAGSSGRRARAETGFAVPSEESRHQRTFMQWPVERRVYRDPVFLEIVQRTIADIANTIAAFEPVTMLAASGYHSDAREKLSQSVELWDIATEDLWCRDAGPIFAASAAGELAVVDIRFNGWGEKQINRHDSRIAGSVAQRLGLPILPTGLHGEAGGAEQDGHGLLLAHVSSWVIENRNPGMTRDEVEARLLDAYGANRMIWSEGVAGQDITDYHIDSLARFTGPGRVLINLPDRPDMDDPFHRAALDTHESLKAEGLAIDLIPEPRRRRINSQDFVASYANFYVCNGAVIVAQFGDKETDQVAQNVLARHYPDREVVALNVDPLGELGGGIHCATQQMPEV